VDAIEFNRDCLTTLRCLHPNVTYTGCKAASGLDLIAPVIHINNLLTIPSNTLRTCELFFAGWPCPPFSTLGPRLGEDDPRILVFKKGLKDLEELAARDNGNALKAFVLEYVAGATQSKSGDVPFASTMRTELTKVAPQFEHALWLETPRHHGVPQSRPRIFFVGVHKMCMAHAPNGQLLPPGKTMPAKTGRLREFLLHSDTPTADLGSRTCKQKANILSYRKMFDEYNDNSVMLADADNIIAVPPFAKVAMCDHSRAPDKAFGKFFSIEESLTLTTSDTGKWVVGDLPGSVSGTGRPFTIQERAQCQGMTPSSMECLPNQTAAVKALGNSMAVDVVGAVIACIMQPITKWERAQSSPPPCPPHLSGTHARQAWIVRSRYVRRIRSTDAASESEAPTASSRSAKRRKVYPRVPVAVKHWDADSDAIRVDWF
jgi:site-specific DNA-cytosine methylase